MYLKTSDRKYLDAALENLPQDGRFGNPWKEFALSMRNAPINRDVPLRGSYQQAFTDSSEILSMWRVTAFPEAIYTNA